MKELTKDVIEIISQSKDIYDSAYTLYLNEAKHILNKTIADPNEIELLLDYILTFCDDTRFVYLYKLLCQRLNLYDAQATTDYVNIYKQLFLKEVFPE